MLTPILVYLQGIACCALLSVTLSVASCGKKNSPPPAPPPTQPRTFTNPVKNGSDPWVYKKDSFYYYSQTLGNRIGIWKTKYMSGLASATMSTVFTPAAGGLNSSNVWAPEIHFINNKWYIYYTAGSGPDSTQRTWVLENANADPLTGPWTDKGRIYATNTDFWAIDGSVMQYNGSDYFVWSGRPVTGVQNQNIYIAKMTNPWTLQSPAVMISKPELSWEIQGGPVNEGPEQLQKDGKNFIIYSASGCWTDDYAIGMLTLKANGDPLNAADWTKEPQPVFTKRALSNAYGPGHNSFFKSADGNEDWIIYHANTNTGEGCGEKRNVRMQKFTWNANGTPNFSTPVATGSYINVPSGE